MSSAEQANLPRWDDQRGWHEIYGLKVCDPRQGVALWLRYVLVSPLEGDAYAELWGLASDRQARVSRVALREILPFGDDIRLEAEPFSFQIGRSVLSSHGARGRIDGHEERLGWVLQWEPGDEALMPYPRTLMDRAWVTTKTALAHPAMTVRGEILINRRRVSLESVTGLQVHQWGTRHANESVWAHCAGFTEDADAMFEGLITITEPVGPFEPRLTMFRVRLDGEDHVANGTLQVLTSKSSFGLTGWSFEFEAGRRKFVGELDVPMGSMYGVVYQDPDGTPLYVHTTQVANLTLAVHVKERGRWELERELSAEHAATMELATRAPDPEIPFLIEAPAGFGA